MYVKDCIFVFQYFAAYFEIAKEKKMFPTLHNPKSPISASVQWHTGLCPILMLLHEGQDAHQFFVIAF